VAYEHFEGTARYFAKPAMYIETEQWGWRVLIHLMQYAAGYW